MNAHAFHFQIISYDGTIFSGDVVSVTFIGPDGGEIEIIHGYSDCVFEVAAGEVIVRSSKGSHESFDIENGTLTIASGKVNIIYC